MKLAELFVEIVGNAKPLNATLNTVHRELDGLASRRLNLAPVYGAAAAAIGLVTTAAYSATKGASNLNETMSKVDVVFGDAAGAVKATADDMAESFGTPKREILDAAAAIGLVGKASGQSEKQAAKLGSDMARLAADASSFYNVPLDDALNKIRSGLVGEAEPLRAFGVLLSEDAVKAEAMRLGIAKNSKELTEAQKIQARTSLITKQLGDATGDLERTQDGAENQTRKFWGQLENLSDSIGTILLPHFSDALHAVNDFLAGLGTDDQLNAFNEKVEETIFVVKNLGTVFEIAQNQTSLALLEMANGVDGFLNKYKEALAYIQKHPLGVGKAALGITEKATGEENAGVARNAIGKGIEALLTGKLPKGGLLGLLAPNDLKEALGIGETLNGPGKSDLFGNEMDALRKRLEQLNQTLVDRRTKELEKGKATQAAKKGQVQPEAAPEKPQKAATTSLEEFAKKLQIGVFAKDDAAKKTADNTGKLVAQFGALADAMKSARPAIGVAAP